MPMVLELPPDLTPRMLTYRDELPDFIESAISACFSQWQKGNAGEAILWIKEAVKRAKASDRPVCECVACICLADLYLESTRLGLAEKYCKEAIEAIRLCPSYRWVCHTKAIIYYLRGLLRHTLDFSAEALADYQMARISFKDALNSWQPVAGHKVQVDRCKKIIKWIHALSKCLSDRLPKAVTDTMMYLTVIDNSKYELLYLELLADSLMPLEIAIGSKAYRMNDPGNGVPMKDNLNVRWNARHFATRVQGDGTAGPYSKDGDYILVRRERQVTKPGGAGVLWDNDIEKWNYGTFVRDPKTKNIEFRPLSSVVIGGTPSLEEKNIGIVRALLKLV